MQPSLVEEAWPGVEATAAGRGERQQRDARRPRGQRQAADPGGDPEAPLAHHPSEDAGTDAAQQDEGKDAGHAGEGESDSGRPVPLPAQQAHAGDGGQQPVLAQKGAGGPTARHRRVGAQEDQGHAQRPPSERPGDHSAQRHEEQRVDQRQGPKAGLRDGRRASQGGAEQGPGGRPIVAVVQQQALPARRMEPLPEEAHVLAEEVPARVEEVGLAAGRIREERLGGLDRVGLLVAELAALDPRHQPVFEVGEGGALVEPRVAKLPRILCAEVIVEELVSVEMPAHEERPVQPQDGTGGAQAEQEGVAKPALQPGAAGRGGAPDQHGGAPQRDTGPQQGLPRSHDAVPVDGLGAWRGARRDRECRLGSESGGPFSRGMRLHGSRAGENGQQHQGGDPHCHSSRADLRPARSRRGPSGEGAGEARHQGSTQGRRSSSWVQALRGWLWRLQ